MGDAAEAKPKAPKKSENPSTLDMVIEAIKNSEDKKGATIPGMKSYILATYPTVDPAMLKSRLKRAFAKGLEQGILCRPKGMEESRSSLSGRFRIVKTKLAEKEKPKKPKVKAKKPSDEKKPKAKAAPKAIKAKSPAKKAAAVKVKKAKAVKSPLQRARPAKKPAEKRPPKPKKIAAKSPGKALKTPSKAKAMKSKSASGKAR